MIEPVATGTEITDAPRAKPRLSADGTALLHAALERVTADGSPTSSSELQHAVQRICIDARRNNWPPEWLLIAFKTALETMPAVQRVARGPDREELASRLVSLCINEFYSASKG